MFLLKSIFNWVSISKAVFDSFSLFLGFLLHKLDWGECSLKVGVRIHASNSHWFLIKTVSWHFSLSLMNKLELPVIFEKRIKNVYFHIFLCLWGMVSLRQFITCWNWILHLMSFVSLHVSASFSTKTRNYQWWVSLYQQI